MLELRNVKTFYGNIQALKDISLEINEGEIITLIGANGAGKTTTLMSICGIVPPRSGEILFQGEPIHPGDARTRSSHWASARSRRAGAFSPT